MVAKRSYTFSGYRRSPFGNETPAELGPVSGLRGFCGHKIGALLWSYYCLAFVRDIADPSHENIRRGYRHNVHSSLLAPSACCRHRPLYMQEPSEIKGFTGYTF